MIQALPDTGYARRIRCYLGEMYPLQLRVPLAVLIGATAVLFTVGLHGWSPAGAAAPISVVSAAAFLLLLLLRLMDELKDVDIDLALFRDRPLPSGRVRESDIRWSMAAVTSAYVAVHCLYPASLLTALPLLGYTYLMYRYFFAPALLRDNLFLNLATHNPVIPLIFLHLVVLTAIAQGAELSTLHWFAIARGVLMLWSVMFAWEIARKIRCAEEENAYVTYSQLLGRAGASALAFGAQTIGLLLALAFVAEGSWPVAAVLPLLAGYAYSAYRFARFLAKPTPESAQLRAPAELYAVLMMCSVILANWSLS